MFLDKKYIKYRLIWFLGETFKLPQYQWTWYRSATLVRRQDILVARLQRKIKNLFLILDLDYNGYLALKNVEKIEIDKIKSQW